MAKLPKPKHSPSRDYPVGYCRPPDHGRIKPGEVRNPRGRNRKAEPAVDAFEAARNRRTRVTIDGETVMMTNDEAFWLKQWASALKDDKAAARNIAKEFGARRNMMPMPDLQAEAEEQAKRLELSAELVRLLDEEAARKKEKAPRANFGSGPPRASGA